MIQVTMREWVVLTFIRLHIERNGVAPTHGEIIDGCKCGCRYTVIKILMGLSAKKLIIVNHGKARGIEVRNVPVGVQP